MSIEHRWHISARLTESERPPNKMENKNTHLKFSNTVAALALFQDIMSRDTCIILQGCS